MSVKLLNSTQYQLSLYFNSFKQVDMCRWGKEWRADAYLRYVGLLLLPKKSHVCKTPAVSQCRAPQNGASHSHSLASWSCSWCYFLPWTSLPSVYRHQETCGAFTCLQSQLQVSSGNELGQGARQAPAGTSQALDSSVFLPSVLGYCEAPLGGTFTT